MVPAYSATRLGIHVPRVRTPGEVRAAGPPGSAGRDLRSLRAAASARLGRTTASGRSFLWAALHGSFPEYLRRVRMAAQSWATDTCGTTPVRRRTLPRRTPRCRPEPVTLGPFEPLNVVRSAHPNARRATGPRVPAPGAR